MQAGSGYLESTRIKDRRAIAKIPAHRQLWRPERQRSPGPPRGCPGTAVPGDHRRDLIVEHGRDGPVPHPPHHERYRVQLFCQRDIRGDCTDLTLLFFLAGWPFCSCGGPPDAIGTGGVPLWFYPYIHQSPHHWYTLSELFALTITETNHKILQ